MLARTLGALATQDYPADRMEVLLVADGCTDDTVRFVRQYTAPWKLHVLEQMNSGPSKARNLAATHARGEVLIFLDDDMEVVPEFVAAHVRIQQTHPQTVAVGIFYSPQQPTSYFSRSLQNWWRAKFFQIRQPGYRFHYDDVISGNFSIHTDFFSQVSGFDPELHCHEDYELGVRLLEAGAICRVAIDAVAYHHDTTDPSRALQRRIAEGKADAYLARKHPGLHEHLPLAHADSTSFSCIVRYLALWQPFLGNLIANLGQRLLTALEFFQLLSPWRALLYCLQEYCYWRGVSLASQPDSIRRPVLTTNQQTPDSVIDLTLGIPVAQHQLDMTRPSSARIFLGTHWVGDIRDMPGIERLRGEHLRRILATEMSSQLAAALAFTALVPVLVNQDTTHAWQRAWQLPAEAGMNSEKDLDLYGPKKVVEIELSNGIPDVDITGYAGLYALVCSKGQPLGCVTLYRPNESLVTAIDLQQSISKTLGHVAIPLAWIVPPQSCSNWPPVSVIVCTRNRTSQLADCLQSLLNLDYLQYEILVVDNAPGDGQTARLAANLPVRYVCEERRGLDCARNRGLHEAQYPIVAFIDDDARADRNWLRAIAEVFNEPEAMAVTGSVFPAELETRSQNLFEFGYGGMNHGFQRRVIRRANCDYVQLLWASSFGVGTNMAFRKSLFDEIKGFDVALDVGTPSSGGGDVEMFHRLVARGFTLIYEPAALVWHSHRPEMEELEKLVSNNGRSFGCFLFTCARNRTVSWFAILNFATRAWLWGWIGKRMLHQLPHGFPRRLVWQELVAALGSPIAYLRSLSHARQYDHRNEGDSGVEHLTEEKGTR